MKKSVLWRQLKNAIGVLTYVVSGKIFNFHSGFSFFWFHTIAEEYELLHYFITISSFMNYEMCIQLGVTKLIVHLLIGFTSFEKVKGYFKQQEGEDVS